MKTESEKLFEEFCASHKINCTRISTSFNYSEKRPDYKVQVETKRALYIEVKQLEPNDSEIAALKSADKHPRSFLDFPSITVGDRIRNVIHKAAPQLKALSHGEHPAIVVIYNNVPRQKGHTSPYAVLTAMHGLNMIPMLISDDSSVDPIAGPVQSGPKKKLTERDNTTVSAVAVLYQDSSGNAALNIYHNKFAKVPLQPEDLRAERIYHFRTLEDESGWIPC